MDRDRELRLHGQLYEIQAINDEVLASRQGYPSAERGYRKTLESVLDCANTELLDEVAEFIKDYIREHEARPANNDVRIEARSRVWKAGYPADEYLNTA